MTTVIVSLKLSLNNELLLLLSMQSKVSYHHESYCPGIVRCMDRGWHLDRIAILGTGISINSGTDVADIGTSLY